jgi:rhamnosyltransferase subunit B
MIPRMSRVLLATFGSLGDLHPYIAVGRALKARGISARIAAPAAYRAAVEGEGLEFAPLRPDLEALGAPEEIARKAFDPWRGPQFLIRAVVMPYLEQAYDDLRAAADDADLLISHPLTYTLPIIAEQTSKPWLSSVLAPASLISRHDPPHMAGLDVLRLAHRLGPRVYDVVFGLARSAVRRWEAPLHRFRERRGLPSSMQVMTFEGQFSPHGTLALFDPVLAAPQPDWPVATRVCGAALHDGAAIDDARRDRLHRFLESGDAPLVFALGSSAVLIADDFWRHAITAATRLRRRAILLVGQAPLPSLSDDIIAFDYLPYSQVFPHAAAVIHQAGIGTLSLALRSGRPQLITPVAFDQPDNAHRAARLGVARVLPFQKVTADRLVRELEPLLAQPGYATRARQTAAELAGVHGAATAAELIASYTA